MQYRQASLLIAASVATKGSVFVLARSTNESESEAEWLRQLGHGRRSRLVQATSPGTGCEADPKIYVKAAAWLQHKFHLVGTRHARAAPIAGRPVVVFLRASL
jgi:hypothetical protein